MVNTPPKLVQGYCSHFKPSFDPHKSCYGCRFYKRKRADPCAWGSSEDCEACQALTPELKEQLRRTFAKRLARRLRAKEKTGKNMSDPARQVDPATEDPGSLSDSLLDDYTGSGDPATETVQAGNILNLPSGISPLIHQTAQTYIHDAGDSHKPPLPPQGAQAQFLPTGGIPAP